MCFGVHANIDIVIFIVILIDLNRQALLYLAECKDVCLVNKCFSPSLVHLNSKTDDEACENFSCQSHPTSAARSGLT